MTDEELDRGIENGSIKVITKPTYGPDENGVARIIGETRRYEEQ